MHKLKLTGILCYSKWNYRVMNMYDVIDGKKLGLRYIMFIKT
jgi:hypothetical protein